MLCIDFFKSPSLTVIITDISLSVNTSNACVLYVITRGGKIETCRFRRSCWRNDRKDRTVFITLCVVLRFQIFAWPFYVWIADRKSIENFRLLLTETLDLSNFADCARSKKPGKQNVGRSRHWLWLGEAFSDFRWHIARIFFPGNVPRTQPPILIFILRAYKRKLATQPSLITIWKLSRLLTFRNFL